MIKWYHIYFVTSTTTTKCVRVESCILGALLGGPNLVSKKLGMILQTCHLGLFVPVHGDTDAESLLHFVPAKWIAIAVLIHQSKFSR